MLETPSSFETVLTHLLRMRAFGGVNGGPQSFARST
jgi:hypothetical protein